MIVLDASVVVELITNGVLATAVKCHLAQRQDEWIVPHLLDVEAASALRKMVAGHRLESSRMDEVLLALATLPAERYPHTPLLPRVWELRQSFTCYDAVYLALAEVMDAVLYTSDVKLRKGHRAEVVVFEHPKM